MNDFWRFLKSFLPWVVITALLGILGSEPVFLYVSLVLLSVSVAAYSIFRIMNSLNVRHLEKPLGFIWIITFVITVVAVVLNKVF